MAPKTLLKMGSHMEVREIISDVARAKNDLAALALDGTPQKKLKHCAAAVNDLETAATEILTTAWIPRSVPELTASIYCVRANLRRLQSDVDDALDVVIERGIPDEFFRVSVALSLGRLLEHQLHVLMLALMHATPRGEWTN
jgi:hypothetical protein